MRPPPRSPPDSATSTHASCQHPAVDGSGRSRLYRLRLLRKPHAQPRKFRRGGGSPQGTFSQQVKGAGDSEAGIPAGTILRHFSMIRQGHPAGWNSGCPEGEQAHQPSLLSLSSHPQGVTPKPASCTLVLVSVCFQETQTAKVHGCSYPGSHTCGLPSRTALRGAAEGQLLGKPPLTLISSGAVGSHGAVPPAPHSRTRNPYEAAVRRTPVL